MAAAEATAVAARSTGREPRLSHHALWLLSGGVAQSAIAFTANLVLVRHLAPSDFGRFAVQLAATGLVLALGSQRVGVQVIRQRGELTAHDRDRLVSALLAETGVLATVVVGWMATSGTLDLFGGLLVAAIFLRHLQTNLLAFHERRMAYRGLALLETGSLLAGHGLAVALASTGAGAIALYLRELTTATLALVGLAAMGGLPRLRPRLLTASEWRRAWREARDVWADGTLESAFARVLPIAAGAFGGHHGAGLYFQAQRLASVPHQLLGPVAGRLALNWFSRAEDRRARTRFLVRALGLLGGPLALVALGTVLFADALVPWLLGPTWTPVAPLLVAMVGGVAGVSLFATSKMFLIADRGGRVLLLARLAQFAGLGLGIGASLLFDAVEGVTGVALGYSLAFVLAVVCAWTGTYLRQRE